jgi:uncharacterized protein (DUF488 family)
VASKYSPRLRVKPPKLEPYVFSRKLHENVLRLTENRAFRRLNANHTIGNSAHRKFFADRRTEREKFRGDIRADKRDALSIGVSLRP